MELIVVGRPNDLIEVDLMVDNWDKVLPRQYKRKVLTWRLKAFSGEESGIHKRLRLSTEHIWDYKEYFKRKLVYLFGKKELERLRSWGHSRIHRPLSLCNGNNPRNSSIFLPFPHISMGK